MFKGIEDYGYKQILINEVEWFFTEKPLKKHVSAQNGTPNAALNVDGKYVTQLPSLKGGKPLYTGHRMRRLCPLSPPLNQL